MVEPDWHLWRAFIAVMQHGTLSGAARALRQAQPTLGRQIAALEAGLGIALFTRSTEGLRPTQKARDLVPYAEAMASAAAALIRAASGNEDELRGTVRLAASDVMGGVVLPAMLSRIRAVHPAMDIELSLSDRTENLLRHDADLAVRNVAPTQAALVARRIGEVPIRLFAHRDYAAAHGLPAATDELARHTLIGRPEHVQQARSALKLDVHFGFTCNSDLGLLAALRAGFGIGYCQEQIGRQSLDLLPVLPGLVLARLGIWLVMHEDLRATRRIRVVFDLLAGELSRYVASKRSEEWPSHPSPARAKPRA